MTITEEKRKYISFKDLLQPSLDFINLYRLLLLDRARKNSNHTIDVYYDEQEKKLIIHMKNGERTIFYNDFECSKEIGVFISNTLCADFIENHRITCSSFMKEKNQYKLKNSYFELYRVYSEEEKQKLLRLHEQAVEKLNTYNSNPTNFEKQIEAKETMETVEMINIFIGLFNLLVLDRVKKAKQHDITIYYDDKSNSLIIHITDKNGTIYYNDFECEPMLGSIIADKICQDFIDDHRITLPCVNSENSIFTIRNTYFTIKRKFDSKLEAEQIEILRENAIDKMHAQNKELTSFEKRIEKMPSYLC